ncbi:MAG TPA: hypothetical protein VIJ25_14060, partial [Methylococcales bacterium]
MLENNNKTAGKMNTNSDTHIQPWLGSEKGKGMKIPRSFAHPTIHPFEQIEWELRSAKIAAEGGQTIFEQENVEVPASWSVLATKVVVSKYFYGDAASGHREYSVKQLVHRVCRAIADRGRKDGYFTTEADTENFYNDLTFL